ncbi:MAG: ComEC/Rec2 family competence protein [Candidatus Dormibacterales bacterium]
MTRFPALVLAVTWCAVLATAVVIAPAQAVLGAVALTISVPCIVLAFFVRPALVALVAAVALLAVARAEFPAADPHVPARAAALAGNVATITGRVADDSQPSAGGAEVVVEPDSVAVQATPVSGIGAVMVRWRGPETTSFGDEVQAIGKLTLPRDLPSFNRRAYLAQHQVFLELQASSINVVRSPGGLAGLPGHLRAGFIAALDSAFAAPHAALLQGVVLGVRQGIPTSLQNALIATGLIHLLVLSGLKVAVFARLAQGLLRPLLGRYAALPAVAVVSLYAVTGGATPAAVRAAAMGGLAIAAGHMGRPTHVWTSLALTAAAMLGWRPELAWDVGFQLSFAGTASIILLTPAIERRLKWLPGFIREPFAVTCAAQVGTLPMMATDFHVISPVAPIANALTLPFLPALVLAGMAVGLISFAPDVARLVAIPITGLLAYVEQVAYVLSRVPAAAVPVPQFPTWLGVAYYAGVAPAIAGLHASGRRRTIAFAVAVLGPALISAIALAAWAGGPPEVSVLAVGDGQAVLVRGSQGAILVDGGPSPSKLEDGIGAQLPPWQSGLAALVITAPGLGHVGGLAQFGRQARTVVLPDAQLTGSAWRTVAFDAATRGAAVVRVRAGESLRIAGLRLQVLAPEQGAPGDVAGAADMGLRVVAADGRSFCDFSDLDVDAQTVAAARVAGACTYLLLPSGGRSLLSPDLERAAVTQATQLIASRGPGRLAAGFPPNVLRTDQEGTITLPL